MNNGNKKSKSAKEITHDYQMKGEATSKRRIHSDSSDPCHSRHPKRPAPVVERTDVLIQDLPEEMMLKIFGCLDLRDLCRAGRVCKTWYEWTRYQQFWRRIMLTCPNIGKINWFRLFEILPSSVTHIRLIAKAVYPKQFIHFSNDLQRRCPNLKTLILHRFEFARNYPYFYSHLPKKLRKLVLTSCAFLFEDMNISENSRSEIEVLDVSHSRGRNPSRPIFNNFDSKYMPNLKELHLAGCGLSDTYCAGFRYDVIKNLHLLNLEQNDIDTSSFMIISMYGIHLTELYVCWTLIEDDDLIFIRLMEQFVNELPYQAALPSLEVICLRGCKVTSKGINSLIQSCPTLHTVVVGNEELNHANNYSTCNTEIVKIRNGFRYCNHNEKADYMHE